MSYIVKNCLARPIIWNDNWCNKEQQFCQNCIDCVIKQVIENCKNKIHIYECYDTDYALGKVECAKSILQLFDIEEIRE